MCMATFTHVESGDMVSHPDEDVCWIKANRGFLAWWMCVSYLFGCLQDVS